VEIEGIKFYSPLDGQDLMKIFDCFMFFNELDILELRLMELYTHVDYFVLVEGNKTHVGNDKEFIFEKNKERFAPWMDKIIHIKVEDFPPDVPTNAQFLENYHRNQISRGLVGIAQPGDRIMVSDVDEIPNMEIVKKYLDYPDWIHFKCDLFYYYVNNQTANGFGGVVVSPYELMTSPQQMRMMAIRYSKWWDSCGQDNIIVNAGWHYSYLCGGDAERVKFKASNILEGHNTEEDVGSVEDVAEKIKNRQDLYNRGSRRYKQTVVDISNNKPTSLDTWLLKHPEYYYNEIKLTIGILSWKEHRTLRNTLDSYTRAGLLAYPAQIFIFFNEIDDEDRRIAEEYGIEYHGAETNLGIAGGYKEMLGYVTQPNFLFLENDWMIREDAFGRVASQLRDGEKFLLSADVIRYRNRREPGMPLWTMQFKGNELSRPEHLLDCVHWHADPDTLFPEYITKVAPHWYAASAKNANWTNNPHMVRTEWAKNVLVPKLAGDIELSLQEWWQKTDYKVVQGEGLFTHDRVIKIRGIDINLYQDENVSNDIRRHQDFFESPILDYIREKYPVQKTIVDAGANIGNHALYFANFLKFESMHCFEPIDRNYKILESNTHDVKIKLYKQALSSEKKTLKMNLGGRNMGSCIVSDTGDVPVEAVTLDSLNLQNVTLLKIDVERHEPELLKGAKETISRCHPLILIEDDTGEYAKLLPGYIQEMYWHRYRTYLYRWIDKPYLIELYTRTPGCANYERTFPIVSDSVRHLPIVLRTYRGHLHRWDHMPMTLGDTMCIFTDSADVIFQKPFPELDPKLIYVSNEGKTFQENSVWRSLIRRYTQFQPMLPEIIYNVGSFACSGKLMKSWCEYLFSVRGKCRQNSIEQLWFNVWLRLPENKPLMTEMPGLFAALYGNVETGTAILKDNQFVTPDGIPYTVVHFNGNLKNIYHSVLYNET
jgi:FkbM family methyltransferase